MKRVSLILFALLAVALSAPVKAQVVTTEPAVITSETKNVVITFHADWGNRAMAGLPESTPVYAHTGVITNKSTSSQDWRYCTSDWNNPQAKFKMTYAGPNLWQLTIPDLKEWYGVPADETIEKLTFVFHSTTGSKPEGKTIAWGDIYLTLLPVDFPTPQEEPYPDGNPHLGVTANPDGSATFCFLAPEKRSVILRGSWNDYALTPSQQMNYTDYNGNRYFWCTVPGVADGSNLFYYYLVDEQIEVGDPYAILVLDQDNDKYISSSVFPGLPPFPEKLKSTPGIPLAVYSSVNNDYQWQVTDFKGPDPSDLIIYELLLRDFTGTENAAQGNGSVDQAINKLDYLQALGVNAVELMPIMEFSGNQSWGYNPNFYMAPDKAYGTPGIYRMFIDECHRRGMAVILDIVLNHVDNGHPWFNMYPGISTPFFNAAGTSPHDYSVFNDWKQECPLVEMHFEDACKYWMTNYKVDGFRFDLVKGMGYNDSYNNPTYNTATNEWGKPSNLAALTNAYNASRVERMKKLHDALREVNPNVYFINENLATSREENEMAADKELNWANVNYQACQFAMGYESDAALSRFYAPDDDNRLWGSTVSYAESHDEERMAYKAAQYGATGVKGNSGMIMRRLGSVAAQMILTPGAHMIWQFQELGANQTTKTSGGGNDTGNKRVVWSLLDNPINKTLHQSYTELCHVRTNNPTLFRESTETSVNLDSWTMARTVTLSDGERTLLLVVNPQTSTAINVKAPDNLTFGEMVILSQSPLLSGESPAELDGAFIKNMPAGSYILFGTPNTAGIEDIPADNATNATPGFTIHASSGTITVYASDGRQLSPSEFSVYTTTGMQVNHTGLTSGIYVVRALGSARKIALH